MFLTSIKRFSTMSFDSSRMVTMASSSSFTQAVVKAIRELYPEKLADGSFDNTGLLLEAPQIENRRNRESVLLTIDLTRAVADEAIRRRDSIIIAYHPIIFRPMKALSLADPQQSTLLRLAQEGISVYCPHTAVDAAPGGLNDWLADGITTTEHESVSGFGFSGVQRVAHERKVIIPVPGIGVPGFETAGYGRIVTFESPQKLGDLLKRVNALLGGLPGLSLAVPQTWPRERKLEMRISSVGICAGSGGNILRNLDVDLLLTGELSHHEALAAVERGQCVVTAFHSNSERAFLKQRMKDALAVAIENILDKESNGLEKTISTVMGKMIDVDVSEADRDPFEIVFAKDMDA